MTALSAPLLASKGCCERAAGVPAMEEVSPSVYSATRSTSRADLRRRGGTCSTARMHRFAMLLGPQASETVIASEHPGASQTTSNRT